MIMITGLLCSTSALAMPSVGDFARFRFSVGADTYVETVTLTSFDANTQRFNKRIVREREGQAPEVRDEFVREDSLASGAEVDEILATCEQTEGRVRETVPTPAGPIDTCRLPVAQWRDDAFVWVGSVPFGIVKQDASSLMGTRFVIELLAFGYGR